MTPLVIWLGALAVVVACAWFGRSRAFALYSAVSLGLQVAIWSALFPDAGPLRIPFALCQALVFVHYLRLVWPRMRSTAYRAAVSIPALWFAAGTLLAFPWAIAVAVGLTPYGWWLPYAICLVGVAQSFGSRHEELDLVLDGEHREGIVRCDAGSLRTHKPLKIVQLSDPHLGPFMSVDRLRRICRRAVEKRPDLILITGDFLTMESQSAVDELSDALSPLRQLAGRVIACHGNHDLEAPATVAEACRRNEIQLLVDQEAVVALPEHEVQIIGADFRFRDRREHLAELCRRFPRRAGHLRLVLLHDPGAFRHLPEGEADLVLSGHTHGGQLGLYSLGLPGTMMRLFLSIPDHGFWSRGTDRLYVHRGNGHYGFPLRLGVPAEESLLRLHLMTPAALSNAPRLERGFESE
ncbi:MAG: metallophosphoesterase [Myxococcales bacterium]|nr:metallophosphoesterase [Myxococcales bacterium]